MLTFNDPSKAGARPVASNIQHYLANCTLPGMRLAPCTPPMPPENHKSHRNYLSIQPERYRKLRRMRRLKHAYVDKAVNEFIRDHIPNDPVEVEDFDPDSMEQPYIPCEGFQVAYFGSPPLRNLEELGVAWLSNTVLRTVYRILHMIPEFQMAASEFSFTSADYVRDEDSNLFRYILWEKPKSEFDESPVKMILAYQAPWILSPRDMEQFASTSTKILPSYEVCITEGIRYNSAHKVWAKLWDICKQNDCNSFVLTNYSQWVFGGFSDGWENGFSTCVKHAVATPSKGPPKAPSANVSSSRAGKRRPGSSRMQTRPTASKTIATSSKKGKTPEPKAKGALSRGPSVLEYLMYWVCSAMSNPKAFKHPPVLEGVALDSDQSVDDQSERSTPGAVTPTQTHYSHPFVHVPSESSWNSAASYAASRAASASGGVEGNEIPYGLPPFLNENWQVPKFPGSVDGRRPSVVHSWLRDAAVATLPAALALPSIPRPPSPVQSEWSDRSFAMRRPDKAQGFFNLETTIEEEYEESLMDVE